MPEAKNLIESYLLESLDKSYPWESVNSRIKKFKVEDGTSVRVNFADIPYKSDQQSNINVYEVVFSRSKGIIPHIGRKLKGFEFKIFSTVISIIKEFLQGKSNTVLLFSSLKSEDNRARLYEKLLRRYSTKVGMDYFVKESKGATYFVLYKKKEFDPKSIEDYLISSYKDIFSKRYISMLRSLGDD